MVVNATGFVAHAGLVLEIVLPSGASTSLKIDPSGGLVVDEIGCPVVVSGETLPGVYAMGLGSAFPCNAKGIDGEKGKGGVVPRADGVDLYVSVYAKPILETILADKANL